MLQLKGIIYDPSLEKFLKKRGLLKQFNKALDYISEEKFKEVDFKLRHPKSAGIWYFRINKQYRGLARIKNGILYIFEIDDHSHD